MQKIMVIDRDIFFGTKLKREFLQADIRLFYSSSMFYNELSSNYNTFIEDIGTTDFFLMDLEFENVNITKSKILLLLENFKAKNSQSVFPKKNLYIYKIAA